MAVRIPRPDPGSGDTGFSIDRRRPERARPARASRARRYEPHAGQLTLPGFDHLVRGPGPLSRPGGAQRKDGPPGSPRGLRDGRDGHDIAQHTRGSHHFPDGTPLGGRALPSRADFPHRPGLPGRPEGPQPAPPVPDTPVPFPKEETEGPLQECRASRETAPAEQDHDPGGPDGNATPVALDESCSPPPDPSRRATDPSLHDRKASGATPCPSGLNGRGGHLRSPVPTRHPSESNASAEGGRGGSEPREWAAPRRGAWVPLPRPPADGVFTPSSPQGDLGASAVVDPGGGDAAAFVSAREDGEPGSVTGAGALVPSSDDDACASRGGCPCPPRGAQPQARRAAVRRRFPGDEGPAPASVAPNGGPGPKAGPGARVAMGLGRVCARTRAWRTAHRCALLSEGAGFRLPGRRRPRRGAQCDIGMSTAEYALGTVTAVAFAGVLYVILTGGTVTEALTDIVVDALSSGM